MTAPNTSPRSTPPPLALTSGPWRARAACRNHPRLLPAAWDDHPGPGRREPAEQRIRRVDAAKHVCWDECPVRVQCLADVDLHYDEGVRGGEDLRELRAAARAALHRGRLVTASPEQIHDAAYTAVAVASIAYQQEVIALTTVLACARSHGLTDEQLREASGLDEPFITRLLEEAAGA